MIGLQFVHCSPSQGCFGVQFWAVKKIELRFDTLGDNFAHRNAVSCFSPCPSYSCWRDINYDVPASAKADLIDLSRVCRPFKRGGCRGNRTWRPP